MSDLLRRPWFETREDALLTMRVGDLILSSIAKRCVSKDEAVEVEVAPDAFAICRPVWY
jgi:hypothetical protein